MQTSCIKKAEDLIPKKLRVAAYARVSSGKDAMLQSLSAQITFYSGLIQRNPDWEYAGVYADEAITGTKASRPEFQRLLCDCKAGKIDLILTKSLSRFARNTVTTLQTVRELKECGVDVWFERENIHALSEDGEFMLTLLSAFAQEESLSASENQKWKIRKNFSEGQPTPTRMLGYRLVGDRLEVIPAEADVVKRIYSEYLSGSGLTAICKKLMSDGVPTKNGGQWRESVIRFILTNEKYVGDMLLQKSYVTDHISKKQVRNNGELPQYYVKDAHEPIIDRETFERVQKEMLRRSSARPHTNCVGTTLHEFTGKILCGKCGCKYRRKKLASGKVVWICPTFNRLGKAYCASQQIPDAILLDLVNGIELDYIRIPCANTVTIITKSGEEITKTWKNPSRSESWTPEMREKARQRSMTHGKKRSNDHSGD